MAREADCDSVQPDNVFVGTGTSIFAFVNSVPGQVALSIQNRGTSGTLEIAGGGISAFFSTTFNINANVVPSLLTNGLGFLVPTTGLFITGPAQFWLSNNSGSTASVSLLRYIKTPYK